MNEKTPGEKAFAIFDYAITVVKVSVVVMGVMLVVIALSGVDMASLDEHEFFRYRMHAVVVVIAAYLLADYLLARSRAHRVQAAASNESSANQARPKRSYAPVLMALAFVAGGGAAFWHDHITHEIPNPVAVVGKFVSASCFDRIRRRIGPGIGPHMAIAYEFRSQSTRARVPQVQCFTDKCEAEKPPAQQLDTESKIVSYASLAACQAALPAVLELKAPATVWTGDKEPNAAVRARFTAEREAPPYFLLWFPSVVAALVLLIFGLLRMRRLPKAD